MTSSSVKSYADKLVMVLSLNIAWFSQIGHDRTYHRCGFQYKATIIRLLWHNYGLVTRFSRVKTGILSMGKRFSHSKILKPVMIRMTF